LALCAVSAALGCTEKPATEPAVDPSLRPKIVLTAPPAPAHPSTLTFDGKVRLLGYDIAPERPRVGEPVTVTWYWQVLSPLGKDWKLFTHVSDGKTSRMNLDAARELRRGSPESSWKKGDLLRDEQTITLPDDWGSSEAVFYLGFYSGDVRMAFEHGKDDGERRAEALRLRVLPAGQTQPTAASLPRLIARRRTGPVKLDGQLDEPDWQAAQRTEPFVNTMNGGPGSFRASAQVLYDAEAFYCAFQVSDDFLKTPFLAADDHLWEQDTVEIMFDPDGDAHNYFELQVSPRGVHFDTRYDAPRDPRPFGHVDWSSQVQNGVHIDGTLDDDSPDVGYTVELRVPWTAFATGTPPASPPAAGDTWRINFFVMDARERGQRAVGWSAPMIGDFHTLAKFGRVVFQESAEADRTQPAPTPSTTTTTTP
jgi:hypothetical protein